MEARVTVTKKPMMQKDYARMTRVYLGRCSRRITPSLPTDQTPLGASHSVTLSCAARGAVRTHR